MLNPKIRLCEKRQPKLVLVPETETSVSAIVVGYAFVGLIDFFFGLAVGWLIWSH